MFSTHRVDESLRERLPLPLAQIYESAAFAKNPLQGFLDSYHLWEAGLRLMTIAAVLEYQARRPSGQPIPKQLKQALGHLARPALGHWRALLRELLPAIVHLGDRPDDPYRSLTGMMSVGLPADEWPRMAELSRLLERLRTGGPAAAPSVPGLTGRIRLTECFDRMVALRNSMIGHSPVGRRDDACYEYLWVSLFAGIEELLSNVDLLGGSRLVYVSEVALAEGVARFQWSELTGLREGGPWKGEAPRHASGHLDGGRVYLLAGDESDPRRFRAAHPYLYFQPASCVFWLLAEVPGQQTVDLLSYTTGETERLGPGGPSDRSSSLSNAHKEQFAKDLDTFLTCLFGGPESPPVVSDLVAPAKAPVSLIPNGRPDQFIGDFETVAEIHRSVNSIVYLAVQHPLQREAVLKLHSGTDDEASQSRFVREIQVAARVSHPNLARVYSSGLHRGRQFYYAMESVRGASLDHFWERVARPGGWERAASGLWSDLYEEAADDTAKAQKPFAPAVSATCCGPEAVPLVSPVVPKPSAGNATAPLCYFDRVADLNRQIAEAAHALHENGVIHRDIKPSNVILTANGNTAVLVDLGSAMHLASRSVTQSREFVGTPQYASPEQVADSREVTPCSDVYAIGVVLWEFLTLRPAFTAADPQQILQQVVTKLLPIPSTLRPEVPRDLEAVALKCVQKDPADRYRSARELADDLQRYLDGQEVKAHRATWWFRACRLYRHHRVAIHAAILAAVVAVLVIALLVSGILYERWKLQEAGEAIARETTQRQQEQDFLRQGIVREVEALSRVSPRFDDALPHPMTWVENAPPALDFSAFHILEDSRLVDLRAWKPDETAAVTMTRRLRVIKKQAADELVIEGRTSGKELIHRCLLPNPQTARLIHVRNSVGMGKALMKIRRLIVDVRDVPIDAEFEVRAISTFRGTLLEPAERWFGVIGYDDAIKISMLMLFPPARPYRSCKLRVQPTRNTPAVDFNGLRIMMSDPGQKWLYWEVPNPMHNHVYQIYWEW